MIASPQRYADVKYAIVTVKGKVLSFSRGMLVDESKTEPAKATPYRAHSLGPSGYAVGYGIRAHDKSSEYPSFENVKSSLKGTTTHMSVYRARCHVKD